MMGVISETVSNAAVKDLVETCVVLNVLSESDLAQLGLQGDVLSAPNLRCAEQKLIDVWQWIDAHSQEQGLGLGLQVGSVVNASAKGLLASWVSQASNLGEALNIFRNNIALMNPSESWEVRNDGDSCVLEFHLSKDKRYPLMAVERSMTALVVWGRILCGVSFQLTGAKFEFSRPDYAYLYSSIFGENIEFESPENQLILPNSILDLPVVSGNEFLKGMMAEAAGEVQRSLNLKSSLKVRVLSEIRKVVESGGDLSVEHVCDVLSLSRQTLFRRLKEEGCDFRGLADQFRKEYALVLLQSAHSNITSVGMTLGYKDSSSFTKAFKRWYGVTPKAYMEHYNP